MSSRAGDALTASRLIITTRLVLALGNAERRAALAGHAGVAIIAKPAHATAAVIAAHRVAAH